MWKNFWVSDGPTLAKSSVRLGRQARSLQPSSHASSDMSCDEPNQRYQRTGCGSGGDCSASSAADPLALIFSPSQFWGLVCMTTSYGSPLDCKSMHKTPLSIKCRKSQGIGANYEVRNDWRRKLIATLSETEFLS